MGKRNGLANPSRLQSFGNGDIPAVVVENPKNSPEKFAFNRSEQALEKVCRQA